MSQVSVRDVTYARQGQPPVLRSVSLSLAGGEILCVLGPNGAGKSTLLRCLLGIETGWSGQIHLSGRDTRSLRRLEIARLVAYVPQVGHSAFSFTVFQYVMMGRTPHMRFGAEPTAVDRDAVAAELERVGVLALRKRRLDELSGGERQLVLVARALAQDTPIILLDEPTASLDLSNQAQVLRIIRQLAQLGRSVLMTTHLPEQAFLLAAQVLLLERGAVVGCGPALSTCTRAALSELYETNLHLLVDRDNAVPVAACVPEL